MERNTSAFFFRECEDRVDAARNALADFVNCKPENLVFVRNATMGVNSVLRSLSFEAGDELLVSDHEYKACRNAIDYVAKRSGAKVVVARIPFPIASSD